jgi:hypothetical protein
MFYETNINTVNNFFEFFNTKLIENNYLIRRYINELNNYELLATSKNGGFSVGFKSVIDTVNNIYSVELQMFKDYLDNQHVNNQFMAIPCYNYKNYNKNNRYYNPMFCLNEDDELEQKAYISITEEYIFMVSDPIGDLSFRSGFYIGKFKSYSLDYQNPWVCLGSTAGYYQDAVMTNGTKTTFNGSPIGRYDSLHQTNVVGWLGNTCYENNLILNYVLEANNEWSELVNNTSFPPNTIFTRDDVSTSSNYTLVQSAHIFPMLKGDKSLGSYKVNEFTKWPISIVSSRDVNESALSNSLLGELYDIIRVKGRNLINDSEYIFDGYKWQCIKVGYFPAAIAENYVFMIRKEKV